MFLQEREDIKVCGEAANGFEAIEKAKMLRPDLALLDLAMPGMNGAEAASVLKKMMPHYCVHDVQREHRESDDWRDWCRSRALETGWNEGACRSSRHNRFA